MSTRSANSTVGLLLWGGVIAAPLFLGIWALQALTRRGFDPSRHPISLLSLGDGGWIQVANFVITGGLIVGCAFGMRRSSPTGRGRVWGPVLVGAFGVGLVIAGVFVTDPGAGFPPGAPPGQPETSWHGALHEGGYVVSQVSWLAACIVLSRRFATLGQRALAYGCIGAAVVALALSVWPDPGSFTIRIVVATAVQLGFVAAVALLLRYKLVGTPAATPG